MVYEKNIYNGDIELLEIISNQMPYLFNDVFKRETK